MAIIRNIAEPMEDDSDAWKRSPLIQDLMRKDAKRARQRWEAYKKKQKSLAANKAKKKFKLKLKTLKS